MIHLLYPRHFTQLLILVLALTVTAPLAMAQQQQDSMAGELLDTLHQFRLQNFIALNAYYNYSVTPDRDRVSDIEQAMNQSGRLLTKAQDKAGDSVSGNEMNDLSEAFVAFERQMSNNVEDIKTSGFPDLRLLSDMAEQAQTLSLLSEDIYQQVASQDLTPTESKVELLREASITMALMVTRYSARSSSSVAQIFQGADTDMSIDELAARFDDLLAQLARDLTDQSQQALLSDAGSKWGFIRNSYINYDERNVSFVINRYSLQIMTSLENLIDRLKQA
ncbi:MAG: hypothetical protein EA349_16335 [Halomonadaceae bacterium]|nr:MAG: hypothetical protein EA349_16335 [Halomonadaceae bacterium]